MSRLDKIGPKTNTRFNTRFEMGINSKGLNKHPRLEAQPKGSMCNYIAALTNPKEVDAEWIGWIKSAY